MPFKSQKQEKYMWANHPSLARKWKEEGKEERKPVPDKIAQMAQAAGWHDLFNRKKEEY